MFFLKGPAPTSLTHSWHWYLDNVMMSVKIGDEWLVSSIGYCKLTSVRVYENISILVCCTPTMILARATSLAVPPGGSQGDYIKHICHPEGLILGVQLQTWNNENWNTFLGRKLLKIAAVLFRDSLRVYRCAAAIFGGRVLWQSPVTKEIKIRFGPIRKTCDEPRSQ